MEETSNGKLEESLKIETNDGEKKQEMIESAADLKPEAESAGAVADGKSELVSETQEGDDALSSSGKALEGDAGFEEKDPQAENSEIPEDEKLVSDSTGVPVETAASSPEEKSSENVGVKQSEVAEQEPEAKKDVASDGLKEEKVLQPFVEDSKADIEVEPKGIEGTMQLSSDAGEVDVSSRDLDQKEIPVLDEDSGEPSGPSDSAAKENNDDLIQSSGKAAAIQTRDSSEATNPPSTGTYHASHPTNLAANFLEELLWTL